MMEGEWHTQTIFISVRRSTFYESINHHNIWTSYESECPSENWLQISLSVRDLSLCALCEGTHVWKYRLPVIITSMWHVSFSSIEAECEENCCFNLIFFFFLLIYSLSKYSVMKEWKHPPILNLLIASFLTHVSQIDTVWFSHAPAQA